MENITLSNSCIRIVISITPKFYHLFPVIQSYVPPWIFLSKFDDNLGGGKYEYETDYLKAPMMIWTSFIWTTRFDWSLRHCKLL